MKRRDWISWFYKNLSMILFIALLGVVYIFNVHIADRKQMKIEQLKKQREEAKWEYLRVEEKSLTKRTPSEIERRLGDKGLRTSTKVPKKIVDKKSD